MAPSIRLVAMSFATDAAAASAATMLTQTFRMVDGMEIAPLAQPSYPVRERAMMVGRFHEDVIAAVRQAVEDAGGTIEMDMPEDPG